MSLRDKINESKRKKHFKEGVKILDIEIIDNNDNELKRKLSTIQIIKLQKFENKIRIICADEKNANAAEKNLNAYKVTTKQVDKLPQMIIKDVNYEIKDDEIIEDLKSRNNVFQDSKLKFITSIKKKDHSRDVIIEVTANDRESIINNPNKIYLGYQICSIKDYVSILQCQKFGHKYTQCKNEDTVCMYCSENHRSKDCTMKKSTKCYKCVNCGGNHISNNFNCTVYQLVVDKKISRTNYCLK